MIHLHSNELNRCFVVITHNHLDNIVLLTIVFHSFIYFVYLGRPWQQLETIIVLRAFVFSM